MRRREQLGPVNPLAKAGVRRGASRTSRSSRPSATDLETALRELRALIRDTDRQIRETFEETFAAAARNFEELAEQLFPGGRGRLRLVREDTGPRPVLGGGDGRAPTTTRPRAAPTRRRDDADAEADEPGSIPPTSSASRSRSRPRASR